MDTPQRTRIPEIVVKYETELLSEWLDLQTRAVTLRRYAGANHALFPAPELEADLGRWLRERAAR